MTTFQERRVAKIQRMLKARTKHDGTPRAGYEQNVASLEAELQTLSIAQERKNG